MMFFEDSYKNYDDFHFKMQYKIWTSKRGNLKSLKSRQEKSALQAW